MPEKELFPYKTINVFIEQNYLEAVMETVLTGVKKLPKQDQIDFSRFMRKYVSILGFRDPSRAPLPLRVNALTNAFEEKDEVVPVTLSVWAKIKKKLAKQVKSWLDDEGWDDLETERSYEENGGFTADWPKKLTFDKLVKDFKKANPDFKFERDDLILMVLWTSGKLPKDQSDI
ncbi:MAG: hypothetical protein SVR81_04100 [Chloroflexota bacterium]|nr:hypothetical protein [Chloroflexota bacterium]